MQSPKPLTNDELTAKIMAVIASFPRGSASVRQGILDVLNTHNVARRSRPALNTGGVRTGDPSTSQEAAAAVNVAQLELRVLQVMAAAARPLTTYDIETLAHTRYGSITPRMRPLRDKGLVAKSGIDRKSGRGRTLFRVTPSGYQFLAAHRPQPEGGTC